MDCDNLLEELDRLLDLGEPLLAMFPVLDRDGWLLELPNSVSNEMRLYADDVAFRKKLGRVRYRVYRRRLEPSLLREKVGHFEAGLLGWRAVGVL